MVDLDIITEEQTVRREINTRTGQVVAESYLFNGELDCDHRPARREFDENTGKLKREMWMTAGKGHRWNTDKPCETVWDTSRDVIIYEAYMELGEYHRIHHRPARIWYSPDSGNVVREEFWKDGNLHRDDGLPAVIEYDADDFRKVINQEYYCSGLRTSAHGKPLQPSV